MNVLSLFSGVGGFDIGLENAGMKTVFQCEIDKHCQSVLDRHWPDIPQWGDITTLTGEYILSLAPVIDVVAWGSPCQDLSVAGKRAGLKGSKSELFHEGIRIIRELRKATNNVYPRISIWENVQGALNSNAGADFGVILDQMAETGALVQEWRVLDAQYFGVPQRRRRVFLVSVFDSATATRCPDPLLPLCKGVLWNSAASPTSRQEPARTITESVASRGKQAGLLGSNIVGSLNAVDYKWPQNQQLDQNKFIPVETFTKAKRGDNEPHVAIQYDGYNQKINDTDIAQTLRLGRDSSDFVAQPVEPTTMAVRRLTPIECERLMGWPDGWTATKADGTPQLDTHRYKQCGNGVASPVAEWVGQQLMKVG